MQDFIQSASSKLGVSPDQAKSATGAILSMLQQQMNPQDYQELQQKLPGSEQVKQGSGQEQAAQQASQQSSQQQGQQQGAGGLGGMVQSFVGGLESHGGAMGALGGLLGKAGLSSDKIGGFVSMFLDYVRSKAGSQMLDKIVQQVPALKSLSPLAAAPS